MTPDTDLIRGCIEGDRRMQEELYRRFSPKMYALCLRYASNAEDAQDALQEGFVKVFRNLANYRGTGSFEGWIRRIMVNTAIEQYRKSTNLFPVTEAMENTIKDTGWDVFDRMGTKDLHSCIRELPQGYRTVFNLYVVEEYTHREIAEMLGISEGTSKSQLARAKTALREIVKRKS